ncbi:hypothetical protein K4F52_006399 [Lecanicillium sp. MT-2017a]|nr:hypothetical protein K4F52_006399 [Lecanicillium sp. MT-2017a]
MLSFIGRTAARRALSATTVTSSAKIGQVVAPRAVSVRRLAPVARSFTASAWVRFPAAAAKGTKKTGAKKTATKKKATKKKAAPKKKAKKAKKPLTAEEKEKAEIRELRKMSLSKGPDLKPESAWAVYVSQNVTSGGQTLVEQVKGISASFKSLSDFEKTRLQDVAQDNQAMNKETRRRWVESYPPEAIYMANLARRRLSRKLNKRRTHLIHDDRLPKRAATPYTLFLKERYHTVSQDSAQETFRVVGQEWKSLPDSEKTKYREVAQQEAGKSREQLKTLRSKGKAYWKAQNATAAK